MSVFDLFDQEYLDQLLVERGRLEWEKESIEAWMCETAKKLAHRGLSAEDIADILDTSTQTVQKWLTETEKPAG